MDELTSQQKASLSSKRQADNAGTGQVGCWAIFKQFSATQQKPALKHCPPSANLRVMLSIGRLNWSK
jgi:hypothetical protein